MSELQKIVVIDPLTEITYVIPYDRAAHEDVEDAIIAANNHYGININVTNFTYHVVDEFKLEVF